LRFENAENLLFQIAGEMMLFWKRIILKANLRFCQTLNCVFKNHFFQIAHFKIMILNRTFWNCKPKQTLNLNLTCLNFSSTCSNKWRFGYSFTRNFDIAPKSPSFPLLVSFGFFIKYKLCFEWVCRVPQ